MHYRTKVYHTMQVVIDEPIAIVRFNRPDAMNAANVEMSFERLEIFRAIAEDDEIKVVIVTGNDKAYCAGGDLAAFAKFDVADAQAFWRRGLEYQKVFTDMNKPTLAAIAGYAFGGGFENVLMCDLRIAAENAKFGLPEINVGIFPGGGGTQRLIQNVPIAIAKEMIFLGKNLNAEEALRLGLVNKVVKVEELLDEALTLAKKLANKPALALKAAKSSINSAYSTDIQTGLSLEGMAWTALYGTKDQKEGMNAFLEKRTPQFVDK
ncbi:enoyl-CoA hydratase/isomerase family protein [Orbus sturtevantii]|uniref:enoyl-CoA hydratase/isomerase family protein n=1 Tax=Orbus sturtevantii TaxID=3074109 RepID=UPI00370D54C5